MRRYRENAKFYLLNFYALVGSKPATYYIILLFTGLKKRKKDVIYRYLRVCREKKEERYQY
jgi:hypothetical protein